MPTPLVYTFTASGDYQLTEPGQMTGPDGWLLTFVGIGWTGSITLANNVAAPGQADSFTNTAYYSGDDFSVISAGTAITATTVPYGVRAVGYPLYARYTHTAGQVTIIVTPANNASMGSGPSPGIVQAGDVASGTFGAFIPDTGTYTFPTQVNFGTKLVSTTALATPSALAATAMNLFASTVSGATLMGFGTTNDVSLKNRAGTTVLGVGPNTTAVNVVGGPVSFGTAQAGAGFTNALSVTASGGAAYGIYNAPTLVAAANNDVLRGLTLAPAFTPAAFTGLQARALAIPALSVAAWTSPGTGAMIDIGIMTGAAGMNTHGIRISPPTGGDNNYLIAHSTAATFNVTAAGAMTLGSILAVGGATDTTVGAFVRPTALTSSSQYGILSRPTGASDGTTTVAAVVADPRTAAAAYTVTNRMGFYHVNNAKGAGSTITNDYGIYVSAPTQGGTLNVSAALHATLAVPATAGAIAAGTPISLYSSGITIEVTSDAPTHTRPKGSICVNTGGTTGITRCYINTDGAGTWTAFTTVA